MTRHTPIEVHFYGFVSPPWRGNLPDDVVLRNGGEFRCCAWLDRHWDFSSGTPAKAIYLTEFHYPPAVLQALGRLHVGNSWRVYDAPGWQHGPR